MVVMEVMVAAVRHTACYTGSVAAMAAGVQQAPAIPCCCREAREARSSVIEVLSALPPAALPAAALVPFSTLLQ